MKLIENRWIRALISIVAGGMTNELVFILSGDPTRPRPADNSVFYIFYVAIFFVTLTWLNKKYGKKGQM